MPLSHKCWENNYANWDIWRVVTRNVTFPSARSRLMRRSSHVNQNLPTCVQVRFHIWLHLQAFTASARDSTVGSQLLRLSKIVATASVAWLLCRWMDLEFPSLRIVYFCLHLVSSALRVKKKKTKAFSFQCASEMIFTWAGTFSSESEPQLGSSHHSAWWSRRIGFPFHHGMRQQWLLEAQSGKQNWKQKNICRWNPKPERRFCRLSATYVRSKMFT